MTGRGRPRGLPRRALLRSGGAAALAALGSCARDHPSDYELAPDNSPLVRDPHGIVDLPPGFSYEVVHKPGSAMSDGYRLPGRPDAMACFPGPHGTVVLMCNHELWQIHPTRSALFPDQPQPAEAYDPLGTGGVTRTVIDPRTLHVRRSNLVLAGTLWNCAGGPSPWGFLSCEETVEEGHGYVFLCDPGAESVQPAVRIDGYGRMRHEAAAVDPRTHIAYLTEDRPDAGFYRFLPHAKQQPFEGVLQALRVIDAPNFDTGVMAAGEAVAVDWVDIANPVPDDDSVRLQGAQAGAAIFRRTEGLWLTGDSAFVCSTSGGRLGRGQVFRLRLRGDPVLEVVAESTDPDVLDMPDNLCASPAGLLYVAEDGDAGNYLKRIWPDGSITPFARNARNFTEFAGPCFTPDGGLLFVNLQEEDLTFAIRGPFLRDEVIAGMQARALLGHGKRELISGLGALALAICGARAV